MFAEDYLQKILRWLSFAGLAVILLLPAPSFCDIASAHDGNRCEGRQLRAGPRYRGIRRNPAKLQLLPTAGSLENLARLRDPKSG